MINVEEIKTREDFSKLKIGDKIILKYIKGKMYLIEITKIEDELLIGKYDTNYIQEVFINIPLLISRDLNKYVECVVKVS